MSNKVKPVKSDKVEIKKGVLTEVVSGTLDGFIITKKGVIYMKK